MVFTPVMFPDNKLSFSSVILEAFIDSYSPWRHQPCSSTPGSSSSWFIAVSVTCPLKTRQNSVNTTTSKDATMSSNRCSWMLRPENERQEWEMFTAQLYRSVLVYIITRVYKYYNTSKCLLWLNSYLIPTVSSLPPTLPSSWERGEEKTLKRGCLN